VDRFARDFAKWPKAVAKLIKDREAALAFYDFRAEHWIHLRTSNPIETRVRIPLGLPGETGNGARPDPSDIHHQRSARRSRSWMACRVIPSSRPRSVME
jgi:hypothetical protein